MLLLLLLLLKIDCTTTTTTTTTTTITSINIDARCGGVAPNTHVRFSLFGKPELDAAEELGLKSMLPN